MALLVTVDNRPIFLSSEVATQLWLVKTGEKKATKEVKAKVATIAKWHLNRSTAPDSWLKQNPITETRKVRGHPKTVTQARLPYVD